MDVDGLGFVVYTKANVFQLQLGGVNGEADILANGISTASFTLDDDDEALPVVWADGSRCAVWFRGNELFRGRIGEVSRGEDGTVNVPVAADIRKLWDWQGWPVPGAALTAQTSEYAVYTGTGEAVFKNALAANFTRLGVPWSVVPLVGAGRGVTGKRAEFRFHPLADKLMPLLDADGLTVTLAYTGSGAGTAVVVDVREAATVPGVFTLDSGVPDRYRFVRTAPAATRAIGGGRGEGVDREFRRVIDAARETSWGEIIETFVDARNTEEGADFTPELVEQLREDAPRVGLSTELVETDLFRYRETYDVGDEVTVQLGPVTGTFPVTGVSITDDEDRGLSVTPHIGTADVAVDADVQLAHALALLARGVRDKGRR
jgi:hypothetical protein